MAFEYQVDVFEERAVSVEQGIQKKAKSTSARRNLCKRVMASALLGAMAIVAPAIASAGPAPHRDVRVPRIDARVIENLQRWAGDEEESWTEEA
jgi:hypothetical protein